MEAKVDYQPGETLLQVKLLLSRTCHIVLHPCLYTAQPSPAWNSDDPENGVETEKEHGRARWTEAASLLYPLMCCRGDRESSSPIENMPPLPPLLSPAAPGVCSREKVCDTHTLPTSLEEAWPRQDPSCPAPRQALVCLSPPATPDPWGLHSSLLHSRDLPLQSLRGGLQLAGMQRGHGVEGNPICRWPVWGSGQSERLPLRPCGHGKRTTTTTITFPTGARVFKTKEHLAAQASWSQGANWAGHGS